MFSSFIPPHHTPAESGRGHFLRLLAAVGVASLALSLLSGALGSAPASAAATIEFVDPATDNYKATDDQQWYDAQGGNFDYRTSFLTSALKIGGVSYVVPQSRLATAQVGGPVTGIYPNDETHAPSPEAKGIGLATSLGGNVSAYLSFEQPANANDYLMTAGSHAAPTKRAMVDPFYRVFKSGVFGLFTGVDKDSFSGAGGTPLTVPLTVKDTAGATIASVTVTYRYDSGIAALGTASSEHGGASGRWYIGTTTAAPTPLNWPSSLAVSDTAGGAQKNAITVPASTASTVYVTPTDIRGLPVPRFEQGDPLAPVAIALAWSPSGAGRPASTSGSGTSRTASVNLPAASYELTATSSCDGNCTPDYSHVPITSPKTTITASTTTPQPGTLTTGTPSITGTASVGSTLTAVPGTWGPGTVALAYQWSVAGATVSGATVSTFVVRAADAGKTVTVTVTGTKSGYTTASKSASVSVPATPPSYRPDAEVRQRGGGSYLGDGVYNTTGAGQTASASIPAGTTGVFEILLQNDGTVTDSWTVAGSPSAPLAGFSHVWKYNSVDVTSAVNGGSLGIDNVPANTSKPMVFTVTPAVDTPVGTVATYYLHTYHKGSSTKDVIGIKVTTTAALGVLTPATPTITGSATAGSTLTAVPGTWGPGSVTLAYQWSVGGIAVAGATTSTYVVKSTDIGKTITVTVTGTKAGYSTATRTASVSTLAFRPDGLVRQRGAGSYVGDGVYNTTGASQTAAASIPAGSTGVFEILLQNDGTSTDSWTVAGSPSTSVAGFTHVWKYNSAVVTPAVNGGTFALADVAAKSSRSMVFTVTPAANTPVGTVATYYLHIYHNGSSTKDVIGIKVTTATAPG